MRNPRIALVAAAALVLAIPSPSQAAGATQVRGLLEPDTAAVCTDSPGSLAAYTVSGSLDGCWYVDTVSQEKTTPGGGYYSSGTETFVGCLGDRCGRFFTTFTFTAKFVDGAEVHGRCHHPIVGGDGDFAGVRGEISMHDLPNGCATYKGSLRF